MPLLIETIILYGKNGELKPLYSIVMEYADGGNLLQYVDKLNGENALMPESEVWFILTQICYGVKCLHDMKIIHRDLKVITIHSP
jgi:serine/threonine protein kinase